MVKNKISVHRDKISMLGKWLRMAFMSVRMRRMTTAEACMRGKASGSYGNSYGKMLRFFWRKLRLLWEKTRVLMKTFPFPGKKFRLYGNKKGSVYVEATFVMPAAVIIAAALITLTVSFYSDICRQAERHEEELSGQKAGYESSYVRKADRIEKEIKDQAARMS